MVYNKLITNEMEITSPIKWMVFVEIEKYFFGRICQKRHKKGQAYCIAPLQLYALASIKTWGIKRSWSYRAYPTAKVGIFVFYANVYFK